VAIPRWKRFALATRWAVRHPGRLVEHREWFLEKLSLTKKPPPRYPGLLLRSKPWFADQHCRPIMDPRPDTVDEAGHIREEDSVVGLTSNGEARAYPWWIMDNHHVANDVLGGRPVALVFCEMCSSAIAFDPVVAGRRLTFEQRHIYNGMITMDDHQTSSVWSPYLGRAIRGQLEGIRLEMLPVFQMEWRRWRELHPQTTVLPAALGTREGHGSRHTIGSPQVPGIFRSTIARWDDRMPHNTLVLGAVVTGGVRAYPLEQLHAAGGVANDTAGDDPIVAFSDPAGRYGAIAYSRRLDGRTLTFSPGDGGYLDHETGSTWTLDGRATAGPLAGRTLTWVESHLAEWFVWAAHYPEIEVVSL
jgi:Protein of unknown function (DUF3179)